MNTKLDAIVPKEPKIEKLVGRIRLRLLGGCRSDGQEERGGNQNCSEKVFTCRPPASNRTELEEQFDESSETIRREAHREALGVGRRKAIFPGPHRDSEEAIEASGIAYTFLRPNGFMQNLVS